MELKDEAFPEERVREESKELSQSSVKNVPRQIGQAKQDPYYKSVFALRGDGDTFPVLIVSGKGSKRKAVLTPLGLAWLHP